MMTVFKSEFTCQCISVIDCICVQNRGGDAAALRTVRLQVCILVWTTTTPPPPPKKKKKKSVCDGLVSCSIEEITSRGLIC